MSTPAEKFEAMQELKRAVCEALERGLPDGPVCGVRIDVKLSKDGSVAKIIMWPEIEYYAAPKIGQYKFA